VSESKGSAAQDAARQSAEPAPEDAARAAIYGLIARLFYAAPDKDLLGQILHAELFGPGESAPARAWRDLVAACRDAFPVVLENEHTELFVGTGKAEITPYLSHYVLKHANDNPLVELRQQLAAWGIGRRESAGETEDHIAGVCETMRFAIAVQHRSEEEQKQFFDRFVYRGASAFCDAVSASPKASFYGLVARFARAFLDLEREAFSML
jgi:TorA maturation chaperone TorD